MEVHFNMVVIQKTIFECLQAPHAKDFLLAIHIDGIGKHMSPQSIVHPSILYHDSAIFG